MKAAVAQLGPIHLADTREAVVKRLVALMREAQPAGARLVVFPELALTTFFPRYWMSEETRATAFFEREMPGPETQPLFDGREARSGLLPRLCRTDREGRALQHRGAGGARRAASSAGIARSTCRGMPSNCPMRPSSTSKSDTSTSATRASRSGA